MNLKSKKIIFVGLLVLFTLICFDKVEASATTRICSVHESIISLIFRPCVNIPLFHSSNRHLFERNFTSEITTTAPLSVSVDKIRERRNTVRAAYIVFNYITNNPKIKEIAAAGVAYIALKAKNSMNGHLFFASNYEEMQTTTALSLSSSPKNETQIKQNRMKPLSAVAQLRKTRAAPLMAFLRVALPHVGNFAKWSGIFSIAGAASSYTAHILEEKDIEKLRRKSIDCNSNNYGCLSNMCWSNCGPRINSADWCFSTKEANTSKTVTCQHDSECKPCWKCASDCFMEIEQVNITTTSSSNMNTT